MIYLASPYRHVSVTTRHTRYNWNRRVARALLDAGFDVFAPVVHGHTIADEFKHREQMMRINLKILPLCDAMVALQLKGWEESRGLLIESELARKLHMPVMYIPKPKEFIREIQDGRFSPEGCRGQPGSGIRNSKSYG